MVPCDARLVSFLFLSVYARKKQLDTLRQAFGCPRRAIVTELNIVGQCVNFDLAQQAVSLFVPRSSLGFALFALKPGETLVA